jgi:hypothetical protein
VLPSPSGSPPSTLARADICSQAVSGESRTCRRGNTPESSIDGWNAPGSIARHMVRTLCAERSRHRFTRRPAICEQCSCCLATRSRRAPCAISGSRLMMRSASRSRSNFSRHICGPAKSQGRSPIRVDRAVSLSLIRSLRDRAGDLRVGPSWVDCRPSPIPRRTVRSRRKRSFISRREVGDRLPVRLPLFLGRSPPLPVLETVLRENSCRADQSD